MHIIFLYYKGNLWGFAMAKNTSVLSFIVGNCYSYLITDSQQAILVDPHISLVEQYSKKLIRKKLSLVGIVDTHTHADHISSAAILKKKYGVPLYMSERAVSSIATDRLSDGDVINVGNSEVRIIYTPGHTDDSISLLTELGDLFTGDVLLINSVGRMDFQNGSPEDMFDSLDNLAKLPEETIIRPAHDYKGNITSTIAEQKNTNPFLLEKDKAEFCSNARSKVMPKPSNMDTIVTTNQRGTAEGFSTVSPKQAYDKLKESNSVLLDVRTAQELSEISVELENVRNIPLPSLVSSIGSLSTDNAYYILCRSGHRATMAAMQLLQKGFTRLVVIEGGITSWNKARLPVKKMDTTMAVERQIRIMAGCLVMIGSLLSLLNIWFILIPLFVGSGLVFAGITNNCLMGILLMKLPYNKKPMSTEGGTCAMDGGGCSM
jgi:glyoxylase-like metal-dependent hydrolase (beta-lactamase superfamily II)/rhodanese-related sulfurtransferase